MRPFLPPAFRTGSTGTLTDPVRRRWCLGAAAALLTARLDGCASPVAASDLSALQPRSLIAPFSGQPLGQGLPAAWRPQVMRRDLPVTQYALVNHDGRTVLQAQADRSTSGLRCDVDVDPLATPWLSWSWRVDQFDQRATVAVDELDDSPARVVVAFDGDLSQLDWRDRLFHEQVELFTGHTLPYATLMYVWDGQAARDSLHRYPRSSRIRYLVVDSGGEHLGQWQHFSRHLADDYRRVFGAEPGRVRSVGVLTDSDDLKTRTDAWFGDLQLGPTLFA